MAEKIAYIYYVDPGSEHVHRLTVTKLMAMDMLRVCLIFRMYFVNITDPAIAAPGWYLADMLSLAGTH